MHILQTVTVVQVVTELFKQKQKQAFEEQKKQLERETAQLLFEKKKAEKASSRPKEAAARYELEVEKRREKLAALIFQMDQLEQLPLGMELKEREVQAIEEVKEGTVFTGKKNGTIVVKDDVIIEIRS